MIRVVFAWFARALLDFGLVLFTFALLFIVVAFRTARRFATPEPDKLDRVSAQLANLLSIGLVAAKGATEAGTVDEPDADELGGLTEVEAEQSVEFWRSVVI